MESATVPRPKINPRAILVTIIAILLAALAVLLYLYLKLVLPPSSVKKPTIPGITHIFSIYGNGTDRLDKPNGVAVDKAGNIYIADTGNGRIMVFDPSGQGLINNVLIGAEEKTKAERVINKFKKQNIDKVKKLKKKYKGKARMHADINYYPISVSLDKNDNIYVASGLAKKIFVYKSSWQKIREIKLKEAPHNAVIQGDRLYVPTRSSIFVYGTNGTLIKKFGNFGKKPGNLDGPIGIVEDANHNTYVADTMNFRLQAFSQRGEVRWVMGRPTTKMNEAKRVFGLPVGLALGGEGNLYLLDAFRGTFHIVDSRGKKIAELGQQGNGDGQLYLPGLIAHVRDNIFLVADKFNNRVQELAISAPGGQGSVTERFGYGQ